MGNLERGIIAFVIVGLGFGGSTAVMTGSKIWGLIVGLMSFGIFFWQIRETKEEREARIKADEKEDA